jgi:predicted enzyme involved in methoxymalonyl-ACP biosynthesis
MFDRLIEAAVARRIKRIVGIYRPTVKNGLVKKLYDQMGFRRVNESTDEVRYELDVPATPVVTATHIRNVAPCSAKS